jgi:CBS domain-containing protein
MSSPVTTLSPQHIVEDAVAALVERGINGAPVVDDHGRLVGLLDDTDLLLGESRLHAPTTIELLGAYIQLPGQRKRFEEEIRHALGRTVGEVMDDEPPAVSLQATVEDVATVLLERRVSRVPVLDDDGLVVGIVTRGDLVRAIGRQGR